jgi:hypothetical protein
MPDGPAKNAAYVASGIGRMERAYLGRLVDDSSQLVLRDGAGRPRLVLRVAADGKTTIRVLDDAGRVSRPID